jgi:hypothetical protein
LSTQNRKWQILTLFCAKKYNARSSARDGFIESYPFDGEQNANGAEGLQQQRPAIRNADEQQADDVVGERRVHQVRVPRLLTEGTANVSGQCIFVFHVDSFLIQ